MNIDDLYEIVEKNNNEAMVKLTSESHPIFKAHFPNKPIMPGFIHFEIITDLFDINITTIKKAKFLKLIKPNQTLIYKKDGKKYQIFCDDEIVASIVL